jgi:hypothetical protein
MDSRVNTQCKKTRTQRFALSLGGKQQNKVERTVVNRPVDEKRLDSFLSTYQLEKESYIFLPLLAPSFGKARFERA